MFPRLLAKENVTSDNVSSFAMHRLYYLVEYGAQCNAKEAREYQCCLRTQSNDNFWHKNKVKRQGVDKI